MDLRLAGKRVLVTGASKGIGRAVARKFAEEGCDLCLVARTREDLEAACAEIRATFGVSASALTGDLRRNDDIARIAAAAGAVDILVNNAGANPIGDFFDIDDATFCAGLNLKLLGFVRMSRALYPTLRERRGVIVNVNGASGEWLDPDYIPGSTANAAVMAFTTAFGRRAARDRVRVVAINPGMVLVERVVRHMRAEAQRVVGDAERWREMTEVLPLGRASEPEEIAAAVAFLASPLAASTTATTVTMDAAVRGVAWSMPEDRG